MFKESHNPEFQYLEKPKQELNSSVWKEKSSTPDVWKSQNTEIVCLENKKIVNSNVL